MCVYMNLLGFLRVRMRMLSFPFNLMAVIAAVQMPLGLASPPPSNQSSIEAQVSNNFVNSVYFTNWYDSTIASWQSISALKSYRVIDK